MPAAIRSLPPTKKRKLQENSDRTQTIKKLEEELTAAVSNNASLNPLADLLELALNTKDAQGTLKGIYALYRIFVVIIASDKLGLTGDAAAKAVKAWLLERLNTFVEFLGGLLKDEEKILRTSALQILFSLQKHLSTSYTKTSPQSSEPQFHISHFRRIVSALLLCPPSTRGGRQSKDDGIIDTDILNQFYESWFSVHDDVRWFFLRESATILNKNERNLNAALNALSVLERLTTFPTESSELDTWWISELGAKPRNRRCWRKENLTQYEPVPSDNKKAASVRLHKMTLHQCLHSLSSHKAVFTRAWLTLLQRLSVPNDVERGKMVAMRVLNIMHRSVLPHLTRAVLVMDWVGRCVDFGGSIGLLALNALFVLMKEYNLDYPSFYTRLYAFLNRDVLHLKHRSRFFRLTDLFLSSTHLPATLLASFIKRLSRLSLTAPPAAIIMIIPFTYNILKRHPALMVMIHRINIDDLSNDPFLPDETNPVATNALNSSLWELVSNCNHYHASVATLCKIFSEAFTKPGYPMEDFLDHTYTTLFETEAKRKIKKEPPLAIDLGQNTNSSRYLGTRRKMVMNELWTFA
ncbi:CBF-domain-containing protein [Cyathus striatus]|nr:CBF-domain-containing protein [Cyathus striatus]